MRGNAGEPMFEPMFEPKFEEVCERGAASATPERGDAELSPRVG